MSNFGEFAMLEKTGNRRKSSESESEKSLVVAVGVVTAADGDVSIGDCAEAADDTGESTETVYCEMCR